MSARRGLGGPGAQEVVEVKAQHRGGLREAAGLQDREVLGVPHGGRGRWRVMY